MHKKFPFIYRECPHYPHDDSKGQCNQCGIIMAAPSGAKIDLSLPHPYIVSS